MKILICTGIYPPDIGGPATYSNLIQTELSKRGHEVSILTYSSSALPLPFEKGGGEGFLSPSVVPAPPSVIPAKAGIQSVNRKYPLPIRYFLYFLKVLQLGKNVDIIYVQDPVSVGLPTTLANWFLKKKLILKIVGDYSWEIAQQVPSSKFQVPNLDNFYPFERKKYPFKIWLLHKIEKWVAKRADKIITPSFYLKNILTSGWGIAEGKIKVIYNSFNVLPLPLEKGGGEGFLSSSVIPAKVGIQAAPFKILSVGRLVPWKGFGTLIEIIKDIPNAELEIIGEGPEYKNYELLITNYELKDRVRLLGRLSHNEVIQKMLAPRSSQSEVGCSNDLFILNSGYEGLSHVILEAMAVGLPVAVSRVGGNMELVGENEERGYLFEYNNKEQIKQKIEHIKSHPEEAQEKAKKARDFVANFSKDKMIEKLEEALQSLPLR